MASVPALLVQLLAALVLAAGVAFAGWRIGDGFAEGRSEERYVVVKGLAERPVSADLAVWPISFTATGDDLAQVQARIEQDAARVRAFLTGGGVPEQAIRVQGLAVVDRLAQRYGNDARPRERFILTQTLVARTERVDAVAALAGRVGELVGAGVVLGHEGPEQGPQYLFTGLNAIKPPMLAEATAAARDAAAQFASDSGSRHGLSAVHRQNKEVHFRGVIDAARAGSGFTV